MRLLQSIKASEQNWKSKTWFFCRLSKLQSFSILSIVSYSLFLMCFSHLSSSVLKNWTNIFGHFYGIGNFINFCKTTKVLEPGNWIALRKFSADFLHCSLFFSVSPRNITILKLELQVIHVKYQFKKVQKYSTPVMCMVLTCDLQS